MDEHFYKVVYLKKKKSLCVMKHFWESVNKKYLYVLSSKNIRVVGNEINE